MSGSAQDAFVNDVLAEFQYGAIYEDGENICTPYIKTKIRTMKTKMKLIRSSGVKFCPGKSGI